MLVMELVVYVLLSPEVVTFGICIQITIDQIGDTNYSQLITTAAGYL
jgi:hypothetical protein